MSPGKSQCLNLSMSRCSDWNDVTQTLRRANIRIFTEAFKGRMSRTQWGTSVRSIVGLVLIPTGHIFHFLRPLKPLSLSRDSPGQRGKTLESLSGYGNFSVTPEFCPCSCFGLSHTANKSSGFGMQQLERGHVQRWTICCTCCMGSYRNGGKVVSSCFFRSRQQHIMVDYLCLQAWRGRITCHFCARPVFKGQTISLQIVSQLFHA